MIKSKRILAILMTAVMTASLMTGCGTKTKDTVSDIDTIEDESGYLEAESSIMTIPIVGNSENEEATETELTDDEDAGVDTVVVRLSASLVNTLFGEESDSEFSDDEPEYNQAWCDAIVEGFDGEDVLNMVYVAAEGDETDDSVYVTLDTSYRDSIIDDIREQVIETSEDESLGYTEVNVDDTFTKMTFYSTSTECSFTDILATISGASLAVEYQALMGNNDYENYDLTIEFVNTDSGEAYYTTTWDEIYLILQSFDDTDSSDDVIFEDYETETETETTESVAE
jgi:hypothetical protein